MNISITLPQSWDEIPHKTLKKIIWLLSTLKPSRKQDVLLFLALQNTKFWQFKKIRNAFKVLKLVPISEIKKHYNFLFKDIELKKFLPYLKINHTKYYAPGKRLHNITIEEFAICEDLFFGYYTTNNLDYIKMLAAVLYRPKIKGVKAPFNNNNLQENAKKFNDIPVKKLLTIAFSYKGSTLFIQGLYKNVFRKTPPTTKTTKTAKPQKPAFKKTILEIAGGKFGNLKETNQTNVHDFLTELNNLLKPKTK